MNLSTLCTDRKAMTQLISEHLGCPSQYLGAPTMAYRIGDINVERDGSITGSEESLKALLPLLLEHGFISEIPAALAEQETEEEDDPTATEVDFKATEEGGMMTLTLPLNDYTPLALSNLIKLLYARQDLINAMMKRTILCIEEEMIDLLQDEKPDSFPQIQELVDSEVQAQMVKGLGFTNETVSFSIPFDEQQPTLWESYAPLFMAIISRARTAHHISSKRVWLAENEAKYFCRNWLIQLGLGGHDHKAVQHLLLDHLKGYAAFRSVDKMAAHQQKYAALRKERKVPADLETAEAQ